MSQRIFPTAQRANPTPTPSQYVDVSTESPDVQFQALSGMLEANDAAAPAPYTGTPPFGEPTPYDEYLHDADLQNDYMLAPDMHSVANTDVLSTISDAFPMEYPGTDWENDDQYFGTGVPPGIPNYGQPIETGHSQIIRNNPAAELGWDAWSGKLSIARVARHENNFTRYNAGNSRGHMVKTLRGIQPYYVRTQQMRDLLLSEIQRRGIHNVVVADAPAQGYTEQVNTIDPTLPFYQGHIGEEGVLP